jgi:hypothetical protein
LSTSKKVFPTDNYIHSGAYSQGCQQAKNSWVTHKLVEYHKKYNNITFTAEHKVIN